MRAHQFDVVLTMGRSTCRFIAPVRRTMNAAAVQTTFDSIYYSRWQKMKEERRKEKEMNCG